MEVNGVKIHRYARMENPGMEIQLFHLERKGTHYLAHIERTGNLGFDVTRQGTKGIISRAFDAELDLRVKGIKLWDTEAEVVTTKIDSKAKKGVELLTHPTFGPDWGRAEETKEGFELETFHKLLSTQVKDWKGSSNSLSVTRHPYWPTFHSMVVKAVKAKYGSRIKVYRGVHGKQALNIIKGTKLKLNKFSSWAIDLDGALEYRGNLGKDYWVVMKTVVPPQKVAMAPVLLPDYTPDPRVLMPLATDVYHVGDELILQGSVKAKIVRRSRKRIAQQVAQRYLKQLEENHVRYA